MSDDVSTLGPNQGILDNGFVYSLVGEHVRVKTVNDAWEYWFKILNAMKERNFSRDGTVVGELLNTVTVIEDPTRNLVTSKLRNLSNRYAIGEMLWYLSGSNHLSDISQFSKAWDKLSDDGTTVNSAYGHRIFEKFGFNQLDHVCEMLSNSPETRQAVIHIKDPNPEPTKDLPCTVCLQYFIRDGSLHATTYMRSNDIWLGFPYDVFTFTCLQMLIAMRLNVKIGTYTHMTGSLHLYQRNAGEKDG